MSGDNINAQSQDPKFRWEVNDRSSEHGFYIYLRDERDRTIGEFSFSIRQMKKLDPGVYKDHVNDPYPFPDTDWLNQLKSNDEDWAKTAVIAMETKPSTVAYVILWKINDIARGNLSVIRQLFRVAIPQFRKYGAEYFVGRYVSQTGEGLSEAPYAREMYERMAEATGGAVHADGHVWVAVEGLAKWLKIDVAKKSR